MDNKKEQERNEKLVKMLDAIGDLKLGDYQDNTIDTFGDSYEFLMTMYASNSGKSGGEFFTPQEVGELLARITVMGKTEVNKVYDPACGSGSLLLKFAKVLGKENVKNGFYGQEINLTTYNLCRINMFLHDINYNNFSIERGDTLIHPAHWDDEPFDAIVSNPPYSIKWAGKSNPLLINDPRYAPAGVLAPQSYADLAFTMHMLSWLSTKGTAAIIEYPGILYRGNAEQKIRKYLVENNYIDTIITMPKDLFFGTTTEVCILVLKKSKEDNNILFINATEEFIRTTNKNKLSEKNIKNILELIRERKNEENKARLVSYDSIKANDYNLSMNSYLKMNKNKEIINIDVCKSVAWIGNEDIAVSGHSVIIRHNQNAKYLSYYFRSSHFQKQKEKYVFGVKVIEMKPANLAKISIPLPTLEEQERIVEILDELNEIVNNMTEGLLEEIEIMKKQYDYYIDKLLN